MTNHAQSSKKKLSRRDFLSSSAKLSAVLIAPSFTARAKSAKPSILSKYSDITSASATELSRAIKAREVSCVEVMQAYLQRIEKHNGTFNALISMYDSDELMTQALQADRDLKSGHYRGWMHGMPHAVKDLSDVKGMITTNGSPIFKKNIASADSIFVSRLRKDGAIFIGKTNVPEFGLGSQTYNPIFGVTRNAYDTSLCAGGSSGGAAVGLATQMLPVADGSDMMGSLRNPAAFNNVIGFRPSFGRVPSKDKNVFYQQLGYSGPMGRNTEDTRRLLSTMSGYDSRSPLSLRDNVSASGKESKLSDYKVAWMGDYQSYLPMEEGVIDLCEAALTDLSKQGLIVAQEQPQYDMNRLWQTWLSLRHWTMTYSAKALYDNPSFREQLKPEAVWEVEGGLKQTGLEISTAALARSDWYKALELMFERHDFLALPTAQVFAFDADTHWPKTIAGRTMDTYHRWMEVVIGGTLSGCPVINLPAGFDSQGRAMGIQFIAPMGADEKLLDFAASYEAHSDYLSIRPSMLA